MHRRYKKVTPEPKAPVGKPGSSARTHPEVVAPVNKSNSTSRATVEVIGPENDWGTFLKSIKKSKVDIAVAFATKTEDLITTILNNGNKLTLTLGTINHFTDPVFIKHCLGLAKRKSLDFEFSVDFRGDNSIHWKLYLVEPSAVVIGSPNLTVTGLSMKRDTAVLLRDQILYQAYMRLLDKLRRQEDVVRTVDRRFNGLLADYEKRHRKVFVRSLLPDATIMSGHIQEFTLCFTTWSEQDKSQILPIFIWGRDVTPEEQKFFEGKIAPKITSDKSKTTEGVYLIGVYEATESERYYHDGDIILTMKYPGGSYIEFYEANVVTYGMGRWWLCGFANRKFDVPFTLTSEFKSVIKSKCGGWLKANKTYLNSNDIRELSKLLKPK